MALDYSTYPGHLDRAEFLVFGLHGRGANHHAFLPFARQMHLPHTRWILPSGPIATGSPDANAWFDGLQPDEVQVEASRAAVSALMERTIEMDGIPEENVCIVGFSQGAAMAVETALRHPRRLGGVVSLSGFIIAPEGLASRRTPANQRLPVFLAHGVHDTVLPIDVGRENRSVLEGLGYAVEYREYDTRHRVSAAEARDIRAFLHRHMFGMEPDDPRRIDEHVAPF
jgi:phospholipase/carboxylesterase